MEPHTLRAIESRSNSSPDKCRHEMFEVWRHSDLNASWEKLVDALDTMEYHSLAQSVKRDYADVYNAQKRHCMSSFCCYSGLYHARRTFGYLGLPLHSTQAVNFV